mgnify:CR=1 FL=1
MQKSICKSSITDVKQDGKGKILEDYSTTGKRRPWRKRKEETHLLADAYFYAGYDNKAMRIDECGTYLEFSECPNGHEKRLKYANFCRERLCPMCQWRRSMKLAWQIKTVCHMALQERKLRFLSLTLTARNVPADYLKDEIGELMYSFRKFKGRKEVDRVLEGYFKALEVTYNSEEETYHPHFHVLLAVKPIYFTNYYITHDRWAELWRQSMQVSYRPSVYVEAVKEKEGATQLEEDRKLYNDDMARAVAETGKYSVKVDDYIQEDVEATSEVIETLEEALKYRRMTSYGGILKEMYQRLNADDIESDEVDLIHTTDEDDNCQCRVCNSDLVDKVYNWNIGLSNYIRTEQMSIGKEK